MPARKLTWKRTLSILKLYPELLAFNGFLLFKVILFSWDMNSSYATMGMVVSTAVLLLALSSWLLLLPLKSRILGFFAFDLLLSVVLLADSLYYDFFDRVIPYPVLRQTGEVGAVTSSLREVISTNDCLLFADFLFLIPFAWLLKSGRLRFRFPRLSLKTRALHAATVCTLSLSVLAMNTISLASASGRDVFTDLYANETVLQKMGVFSYHIADLYNNLHPTDPQVTTEQEIAHLQVWMNQHRKENETRNLLGAAKGLNVIIIQMEALQEVLIDQTINGQEITPNLNALIKRSLYFDNYTPQTGDGNTSDAEFMSLNSLYPLKAGNLFMTKNQNTYESLPRLLREAGYSTNAFHNFDAKFFDRNKMYVTEGFDHFYSAESFKINERIGWGLTDNSMYIQSIPIMQKAPQPSFNFFISLTGHHPYYLPQYEQKLNLPDNDAKFFNDYLQVQNYADRALGGLVRRLEQQGMLDKTLLIVYGDHPSEVKAQEFAKVFDGHTQELTTYERTQYSKVPLLIHFPHDANKGVNHIQGGQIDFFPTIANLLGLDRDKMFYFGQDLLNAKEGYTALRHHYNKGTFLTDDLFYEASNDGIFLHGVCYDRKTNQKLDIKACADGYKKATWEFEMSDMIHDTNKLPVLLNLPESRSKSQTPQPTQN